MNEIQMTFYSLVRLFDKSLWIRYFSKLEELLSSKLSHLDTNDPIRKKVSSLEMAAEYVCSLNEKEESRWLFGKFGKSKMEISIYLQKDTELSSNKISLYFPEKVLESSYGIKLLNDVFLEGARYFRPFYALCDFMATISEKKKSTGFSVDLQAELIGVFWLTYLNKDYVEFFGKDRFEGVPCQYIDKLDSVIIKIGESPLNLDVSREEIETLLGRESFVDPSLSFDKPVGKNALTFGQMVK